MDRGRSIACPRTQLDTGRKLELNCSLLHLIHGFWRSSPENKNRVARPPRRIAARGKFEPDTHWPEVSGWALVTATFCPSNAYRLEPLRHRPFPAGPSAGVVVGCSARAWSAPAVSVAA